MSEIRNCAREDIPAVAALFQRTFRKSDAKPPASLETHLADVYLDHPWYDPEVASRVHVNDAGRVTGFVGVFPGRFELTGRPVRAAIAGSLMVDDPEADPLAGAKLLRSVVKGPQDISISETTNPLSQALWDRLGGSVVPLFSLDWFRVMRPGGAAVALLAERHPIAAALAPAAWAGDLIGGRLAAGHLKPAAPSPRLTRQTEPADSEFAAAVAELTGHYALRPAWSEADIGWFLGHAARKERYGDLHRTIVRNGKGRLVGCYVYHARAGGTGRVLEVMTAPGVAEEVVDCLLHEADEARLSVLRGRTSPQIMNALLTRNCVFVHRASTVFQTADADLAAAAEQGAALITGLAGERWTRLIGGEFV